MDTFDPKPKLLAADGKMTGAGGGLSDRQRPLLRPMWRFVPAANAEPWSATCFRTSRERMDDVCLIRSMKTDDNEHYQATLAIHTGSFFFARPSLGSWVSYGLGTMNQNLPSFVVIAPYLPYAGSLIWANDFLPADHQGTRVFPGREPLPNLRRASTTGADLQELELGLAARLQSGALATTRQRRRVGGASAVIRDGVSTCNSRRPRCSTCRARRNERWTCTGSSAAKPRGSAGSAWWPGD